jgi:hypothetical protein
VDAPGLDQSELDFIGSNLFYIGGKTMRNSTLTKTSVLLALGVLISGFPLNAGSAIAQQLEPVTVHTIVRAESDIAFKNIHDALGFNVFLHRRAPVAIDQQDVIRMNRDTIYSSALLDLSQPAFINMPETDGRYMNLQIISQDHYSYAVTQSGRHEINQDKVGTRYAGLVIRTFIDADDPEDIAKANALQDQVKIEGGGEGLFEIPNWNIEQMLVARDALNTLGSTASTTSRPSPMTTGLSRSTSATAETPAMLACRGSR